MQNNRKVPEPFCNRRRSQLNLRQLAGINRPKACYLANFAKNSLFSGRKPGETGSHVTAHTTKRKSLQRSYNEQRPHSALGYLTPAAYAANLTATCDRLRNPEQLRRSHVAPAPDCVEPAENLIAAG